MSSKSIFNIIITSVLLISCKGQTANEKKVDSLTNNTTIADTLINSKTNRILVDSAKELINDANYWMEKGIRKQLPPSKVNDHIKPVMAKYEEIYKKLSPSDTIEVRRYRIEQINKMIDLQIKLNQ